MEVGNCRAQTHLGRDAAHLDKAKTHHHELLGSFSLFVATRSQAKRVAEFSAEHCDEQHALLSAAVMRMHADSGINMSAPALQPEILRSS